MRSLLTISGALQARAGGLDPTDRDTVVSVLSLAFDPAEEGAGVVRLILAGDGEIAVAAECLDVALRDVSRPYLAQSKSPPTHDAV